MCGVPGSGKTTFAKKWFPKTIKYVSRDEIRFSMIKTAEEYFSKEKEVFSTFVNKIQTFLDADYDVVADATHINKASRFKLYSALNMKNHVAAVVVLHTSLDTCLTRNDARQGTLSFVPHGAIRRMYSQFTFPSLEEELYLNCIYIVGSEGHASKIIR